MKMIMTEEMVVMKEELKKWRDYRRKLTRLRGLMWSMVDMVVGTNEVKQGADDRKVDGYEKVE